MSSEVDESLLLADYVRALKEERSMWLQAQREHLTSTERALALDQWRIAMERSRSLGRRWRDAIAKHNPHV